VRVSGRDKERERAREMERGREREKEGERERERGREGGRERERGRKGGRERKRGGLKKRKLPKSHPHAHTCAWGQLHVPLYTHPPSLHKQKRGAMHLGLLISV